MLEYEEMLYDLFSASEEGDLDALKVIFSEKYGRSVLANIANYGDNCFTYGITPLLLALYHGHKECVEFLIQQGADVNCHTMIGYDRRATTPLIMAAENGHVACVKLLIGSGAEVDKKAVWGKGYASTTALIQSAYQGHLDCLHVLLSHGAAPNLSNESIISPLLAVNHRFNENSFPLVKALVEAGANINQQDWSGDTLLINLTERPETNATLIEYLVSQKADVTIKNKEGDSALSNLMERNPLNEKIFNLLLENGADINNVNNAGQTLLSLAMGHNDLKTNYNTFKILIEAGIDINYKDSLGNTPIMNILNYSYFKNQQEVGLQTLDLFIGNGAMLNIKNNEGDDVFDIVSKWPTRSEIWLDIIKSSQEKHILSLEIAIDSQDVTNNLSF